LFLTGSTATNFNGFSTNPALPFSASATGDKRIGPFLKDLKPSMYSPSGVNTVLGTSTKTVLSTTSNVQVPGNSAAVLGTQSSVTVTFSPSSMPWIVDPYGMPYAYFATIGGKNGLYCAPETGVAITRNPAIPQSYTTNFGPPLGSYTVTPYISNGSYLNANSFQIISAGKDMFFGPGGTQIPTVTVGADDQANFSKTLLGGGIN